MNLTQAKEKLEEIEWYNQAGAVKPFYISYPWYTCSKMSILGRKIPAKYDWLVSYKDNYMDNYLSKKSLVEVAAYYYQKQMKEKNFIRKLSFSWHKNHVNSFKRINNKILTTNLSSLSTKELFSLFSSYNKAYLAVWHEAIFLDGFDFYGEDILKGISRKENITLALKDLETLLTPPLSSSLQKERLGILRLAENIMRTDKNKFAGHTFEEFAKSYPEMKKEFFLLSKKYYWLHNDYASMEYLEPKYFFNKLNLLLDDPKKLSTEKMMRRNLKDLHREKRRITKKYKLSSDFINTTDFLAFLGNFRDERKTYNQMAGNSLYKFAKEFSLRIETDLNTIEHLFFWELSKFFKAKKKFSTTALKRMHGAFFFIHAADKFSVFYGRDALELNTLLKDKISRAKNLRGRTAFPGKAEGVVKIIKDKNDFGKMEAGNILVAPNTRPEFVPIMKKARAIVTDEGGITSHAAIVARELKIPCIVGVQCATTVLKDGDLIEVNAKTGKIKILQ